MQLEEWTLSIEGMVDKPLSLRYADLQNFPQRKIVATLECIGNPVGGESIGTAEWEGIPLHLLLKEVGANLGAIDLVIHAKDGYSDSLSLSRAQETDVLLALKMNGVPLPPDHGYPARIIVPGFYGIKNVKWLTQLEVVNYDYKGHWQQEGWSEDAAIKPMSRIDQPGDRQTIQERSFKIRGIAFAGRSGVGLVEVSTNASKTWHTANLEPKQSPHSWTFWNYDWQVPKSGEHVIVVRATDGNGHSQSTKSGDLHAISVEVV